MGVMPLGLRERPDPPELDDELLQAFNVLSSSRHYGMAGPLAITIGEMHAYCQMFGIESWDDRERFVAVIQKLDGIYIERRSPKSDKETKSEVVVPGRGADNAGQR